MKKKKLMPRNSPKQERSKRTRGEIIEATARLLNARDENEVTTNHIAKTTGISIGTLYKHYPNKEAILSDLIDHYMESDLRAIEDIVIKYSETKSSEKLSEKLIDWIIETHKEQHQLRSTLYSNLGRLLKNKKALNTRIEIGNKLSNSDMGHIITNPRKVLMIVAAVNGMIHMLSQIPSDKEDWKNIRVIGLRLLSL